MRRLVVWQTVSDVLEKHAASIIRPEEGRKENVLPWRWRQDVPLESLYLFTKLHGFTFQNAVILYEALFVV
jgi:hypothetical protein